MDTRTEQIIERISQLPIGDRYRMNGVISQTLRECGIERSDDLRTCVEVLFDGGACDLGSIAGIPEARIAIESLLGQSSNREV